MSTVVKLSSVENYIEEVDRNGYFEVTDRSIEDQKRNQMYRDNIKRQEASQAYQNYSDYLISLKITCQV